MTLPIYPSQVLYTNWKCEALKKGFWIGNCISKDIQVSVRYTGKVCSNDDLGVVGGGTLLGSIGRLHYLQHSQLQKVTVTDVD